MIDPTVAREARPRQGHLEADGPAAADTSSKVRAITFQEAEREIRRALGIHNLGYICGRLADCILRLTLAADQLRVLLPDELSFTRMTGIAKQHVNDGLKWLDDSEHGWKVFSRPDNWYGFLVPSRWTSPLHSYFKNRPGRVEEAKQLELRLATPSMKQDDWERGPSLDEELLDLFLKGLQKPAREPVTESVTLVTESVTGPVTESVTPVTESVTPDLHLTNVGTKRSFNRSTLNGQKAPWKYRLERVQEFLRLSGEDYLEDEMARLGGMWTILAKQEGELLERAVADLEDKERTGSRSEDRAKRLTRLVREWIEPARWSALFPGPS